MAAEENGAASFARLDMAFGAVRRLVLIAAALLAASPFTDAQQADPSADVEVWAKAHGGAVVYGDADVGHAIVEVQVTGRKVTPQTLGSLVKPLAELPHLRRLVVGGLEIRDDELRLLAGVPHLKDLQLNGQFTGAGVAHLVNLRELTSLGFFCSQKLSDTALLHVKSMPQLRTFRLVGTPRVTDAGLKLLRELPALEELTLKSTGVTAEGLDALAEFPALRRLTLVGAFGSPFDNKRIDKLRAALPECEITTK